MTLKSSNKIAFLILLVFTIVPFLPKTASAHLEVDYDALNLREGDIVGSSDLNDPDIYIINEFGFKRLFLSPTIFGFYGHLRFSNVKRLDDAVIDKMLTSGLFRNCETNDQRVYALEVNGEDSAVLRWANISGEVAAGEDHDFFQKVFCINSREFSWYSRANAYTSYSNIPTYRRSGLVRSINETNMPLSIPAGYKISLFTRQAVGPLRFMAFSPDGILFVSMPSSKGLYADGRPDDGKIFAMPDKNNDGIADEVKTVIAGLHVSHGIAFYNSYLYVAEEGKISRYSYMNDGVVGSREVVVANLPTGGEHVSRTIGFSSLGKMYVSVGSACNNCTTGEEGTAAIWEFNPDGSGGRIYARGLRNGVGFVFNPTSGEIWATENGRDFLGEDLPPDEINIVRDSSDYGWPYCYGAKVVDSFYKDSIKCKTTQASVYDLQAHSAPLGLRFVSGAQFSTWAGDLLVARHGSWNRTQPVGYDVVRLDVEGNNVVGEYPFITGWLTSTNSKLGRPVDVIFGPDGALYISDDKANIIYRVSKI